MKTRKRKNGDPRLRRIRGVRPGAEVYWERRRRLDAFIESICRLEEKVDALATFASDISRDVSKLQREHIELDYALEEQWKASSKRQFSADDIASAMGGDPN